MYIERRRTASSNISGKGRSSVHKGTWDPESCTYEHYHLANYIKVPHSSFVLRHSVAVALHLPFPITTPDPHEFLQVKTANTNRSCARHPRYNPEIGISCTRERDPEKSAAFKSHQPDLDMLIFLPSSISYFVNNRSGWRGNREESAEYKGVTSWGGW